MNDLFLSDTKGAEISECGKHRFSLHRIWDNTKPIFLIIGLNPSTADAYQDDNTIRRCIRFVTSWGGGGFYMMNLFSFRTKSPKVLLQELKTYSKEDYAYWNKINTEKIINTAALCKAVIFAWGAHPATKWHTRAQEIIDLFPDAFCITKTDSGHPQHPLMIPKDKQPVKFDEGFYYFISERFLLGDKSMLDDSDRVFSFSFRELATNEGLLRSLNLESMYAKTSRAEKFMMCYLSAFYPQSEKQRYEKLSRNPDLRIVCFDDKLYNQLSEILSPKISAS